MFVKKGETKTKTTLSMASNISILAAILLKNG